MTLLFRDFDRRIEIRSTREGMIRFHQVSADVAANEPPSAPPVNTT